MNSGQITTDKADFPFVALFCRINVLEAVETIQAHYGCYFYAVIYTRTGILPRMGFGGRLTVIGIATFQKREKESLRVAGESDFDPCCTLVSFRIFITQISSTDISFINVVIQKIDWYFRRNTRLYVMRISS